MPSKTTLLNILLLAITITGTAKDNRDGLIDSSTAIFYPSNFDPVGNLPSFALISEPGLIGKIPANWQLVPHFYSSNGKTIASMAVQKGTSLYGTGEVTGPLTRNGKTISLWNTDNYLYSKFNGENLYQSHPWVMGVNANGTAFGIIADNTWRQQIILADSIKFISYGPPFRVIVIKGNSPKWGQGHAAR